MSTPGTVGTDAWRRPDRRMLLIAPVEAVKDFLPLIVVALVAGSTSDDGLTLENLWVTALPLVAGVWRWATTRYRITPDRIMVERGLVESSTVTARLDRVRTVDLTASPLQRLLGLAEVQIGTGSEQPVCLPGIARGDAQALRTSLLHAARHPTTADDGPADTRLATMRPSWILLAPFSLSGLLAILAVLAFGAQLGGDVGERVLDSRWGHLVADHVRSLSAAELAVQGLGAALALLTVASLASYVLRFWGYTLTRHAGGTLAVGRGLLTTRHTSVEERRLRGVVLVRPFLLRLVDGARAEALVTGLVGGGGGTDTSSSDLLVPPAPHAEVRRIVGEVLHDGEPLDVPLRAHGPAARRRRHMRSLTAALPVTISIAVATWWFGWPAWTYGPALLPVVAAPILAESRYRRLGHAFTGAHLVSRHGAFPETTTVVRTSAIIGWNLDATLFQRRAGLLTLAATIAAGDDQVVIPDVTPDEAYALMRAATPGLPEPFMQPVGPST